MEITEVIGAAALVLLGAVITATINYIGTKQHDNTQMNIHRNTLQQQTNEAKRDRIVEARKPLLIDLRESLGRIWGAHSNFISASITIQRAQSTNIPADSFPVVEQHRSNHREATVEAMEHISRLVPQLNDSTLTSQIETYMAIFLTAVPDAILNSPTLEALNNAQTALTTARQYQLVANKRIEELLSGDDPT